MIDDPRVEALMAENERLRDQVQMLQEALGSNWMPPIELGLTPAEGSVVGCLMKFDYVSKDRLMAALYDGRPDADEVEPKIVDVFICKIRKKFRPYGFLVDTLWGRGYALSAATKASINRMKGEAI